MLVIKMIFLVLLAWLPPCPDEDSPGPCGWDVRTQGPTSHGDVSFVKFLGPVGILVP